MTKPGTVFTVITAAVLLTVVILLIPPISEAIREKQRYADFNSYTKLGSEAYFEKDYAGAYRAFADAYDSLIPENDADLAKKADACLLAADCQTQIGDTDGAIGTLMRGYEDTEKPLFTRS